MCDQKIFSTVIQYGRPRSRVIKGDGQKLPTEAENYKSGSNVPSFRGYLSLYDPKKTLFLPHVP